MDSGNEDALEMRPLLNIALGRDVITADRDLRSSIAGFHLTSLEFPYLGIHHIGAPDP